MRASEVNVIQLCRPGIGWNWSPLVRPWRCERIWQISLETVVFVFAVAQKIFSSLEFAMWSGLGGFYPRDELMHIGALIADP